MGELNSALAAAATRRSARQFVHFSQPSSRSDKALLVAPNDPLTSLSAPLIEACSQGRLKDVQSLLAAGADASAPVEEVGRNGSRRVLPMTAAIRVLARGDALPRVAQRQSERIIEALLGAGARMRVVEREMLVHTARMGLPDMLTFLASHGARVRRYAHELMEIAMLQRHLSCVSRLRELGVDPDVRDAWGSTVFLDVCSGALSLQPGDAEQGCADVDWYRSRFQELFALGVRINGTDAVGATALMRAIVAGEDAIAQALLEEGANTQPTLRNGVGAVHLAAASGSLQRLQLVLRHADHRAQLQRLRLAKMQPDIKAFLQSLQAGWEAEPAAVAC